MGSLYGMLGFIRNVTLPTRGSLNVVGEFVLKGGSKRFPVLSKT